MKNRHLAFNPSANQEGQAITEYLLLLFSVVAAYMIVVAWISKFGLSNKLTAPIRQDFAMAYKYGHPKATGYDEGTPQNHPRIRDAGNFRIFINPDPSGGDSGGE